MKSSMDDPDSLENSVLAADHINPRNTSTFLASSNTQSIAGQSMESLTIIPMVGHLDTNRDIPIPVYKARGATI